MNTIAKNETSQAEPTRALQEFITVWNALSFQERRVENSLTADAERIMDEIRSRTCPAWCDKEMHETNVADFWDCFTGGSGELHGNSFGDGIAISDPDALSRVTFIHAVDALGNILNNPLDKPTIEVNFDGRVTVAEARALAVAILEAADFWEKFQATA